MRAADPDARGAGGPRPPIRGGSSPCIARDVAAYVDAVPARAGRPDALEGEALARCSRSREATRRPWSRDRIPLEDEAQAPRRLGDWELRLLGTKESRMPMRPRRPPATRAQRGHRAKDLLTAEVVPLDEGSSLARACRPGRHRLVPHRLLYNVGTFSTHFVWGAADANGERCRYRNGPRASHR